MTDTLITMNATTIGGRIIPGGAEASKYPAANNGLITVKGIDAPSYLQAGAKFIGARGASYSPPIAPRAASAARIVSSTSLANGTLSIANQPDVPRQLGVYVDPGTTGISAGNIAVRYIANDGQDTTDNVSPVTPASTAKTVTTSKGAVSVTSVIVTALSGGASPLVQVNDTNSLSVMVQPYYTGFALSRAFADGAVNGTTAVASSAASYTPSTTPNATHTYEALYTFNSP